MPTSSNTSKTSKTSLSLLQRAARQEPLAWEQFVDLYAPLVHQWTRQRRIESHAAADIVQEVFSSLHRSLSRYQSNDSGTFRGWLWAVTRNKILDHLRKETRQPNATGGSTALLRLGQVSDEHSIPDSDPTTDELQSELLHRAVSQVQGEFEPRTWQAFWRTVIDGIRTDIVAEELGMKPATVRQSKSRVLRRLRCQLGEH